MLHAIASWFIGTAVAVGLFFGIHHEPQPAPDQSLGTSLPSGTAVFETSLASRISSTDTSLTLVANSVRGGSTLSGHQCFTIDEGRTDAEYVCGTVSGTSVTSLTRGIDPSTGTTTNSTLKFAHRVGANVKITDFPLIQILRNQANGADTYPNPLRYESGVTPTNTSDLTDKEYVDGVAFSGAGVIDATTIAKGVVELATGCEAASSTSAGTSGNLVVPATLATSTYNAATAACKVIVTGNTGLIDENFLPATTTKNATTTGLFVATATTTLATTTVQGIDPNAFGRRHLATSSPGTWTVPGGVETIRVRGWGAGAGASGATDTDNLAVTNQNTAHGMNGNYCEVLADVSPGDTFTLTIGTGGSGASSYDANGGTAGGSATFIDGAGAGAFTLTVGAGQSARAYGSACAASGTKHLASTTLSIIGGGNAGGLMPAPNNSSNQTGGSGENAAFLIEW